MSQAITAAAMRSRKPTDNGDGNDLILAYKHRSHQFFARAVKLIFGRLISLVRGFGRAVSSPWITQALTGGDLIRREPIVHNRQYFRF